MEPRALEGRLVVFEGLSSKILTIWLPKGRHGEGPLEVIRARDVSFDEDDLVHNPTEETDYECTLEVMTQGLVFTRSARRNR